MNSTAPTSKKIQRLAAILTRECLGLMKSNSLLVIADDESSSIATAVWQQSLEITPTAYLLRLPKPAKKIDQTLLISKFMNQVDLILLACKLQPNNISLIQNVMDQGSRVACLATTEIDFLSRTLVSNSGKLAINSQRLADIFTIGKNLELKCKNGTDLCLSLQRERGIAEIGKLDEQRKFTILPGGRAQIRPKSGSCNGIVIPNGSIDGVGLVREISKLQFETGKIVNIRGGSEAKKFRAGFQKLPSAAKDIVRIGVGTNHHAHLSGNLDEDERAAGIIHLGIGSYELSTPNILTSDYLRITIRQADLSIDGKLVVKKGKIVV